MMHNIAGMLVQVIRLKAIFFFGIRRSECFGSYNMFTYSHLIPPHDLQQPFFFSRGATFALTRLSIIGNFLRYSLK